MSGQPGTFPCPWCGMTYPVRPVLVGKAVRCKGCGNPFMLAADGTASRVQSAAPAPAPAPAPAAAPVPAPRPAPAAASPPEDVLDLDAAPAPSSRPGTERSRRGKTDRLEAARAEMAAQLAGVAAAAASSDAVKREERGSSSRFAKTEAKTTTADAQRKQRSAVLTGEGDRAGRERRVWILWSCAAVATLAALAYLLTARSAERRALDAYAATLGVMESRYPAFGDLVRQRAWLAAMPSQPFGPDIAEEVADASFHGSRVIELGPLKPRFAELRGRILLPGVGVWAKPEQTEQVATAAAGHTGEALAKALAAAKADVVVHQAWLAGLGLSDEDAAVVSDLVLGTPPKGGIAFARRLIEAGEVPDRLHLRAFGGRRGQRQVDIGMSYVRVTGAYTGLMMRIEGQGWPGEWRVLRLRTAD